MATVAERTALINTLLFCLLCRSPVSFTAPPQTMSAQFNACDVPPPRRRSVRRIDRHSFVPAKSDLAESIESIDESTEQAPLTSAHPNAARKRTRSSASDELDRCSVAQPPLKRANVDVRTVRRVVTHHHDADDDDDDDSASLADSSATELLPHDCSPTCNSADSPTCNIADRHPLYARVVDRSAPTLQNTVRQAAQFVINALGPGFSESVYRDALAAELQRRNVRILSDHEVVLPVRFCGRYVGFCRSDMVLLCAFNTHQTCAHGNAFLARRHPLSHLTDSGVDSSDETVGAVESMRRHVSIDRDVHDQQQTTNCACNTADHVEPANSPSVRPCFSVPRATLVIELKAQTRPLHSANVHQLLNYMRLLRVADGMLINFEQRDTLLQSALQQLSVCQQPSPGNERLTTRRMADSVPVLVVQHRHRPLRHIQCVLVHSDQ